MPYPAAFLIHTCYHLKRHTSLQPDPSQELNLDLLNSAQENTAPDEYGTPSTLHTPASQLRCRFGTKTANLGAAGYYSTTTCTLQPNTDIEEDDLIATTTPGYAKMYWVNAVRQIYEATGNHISHTILDLRETEETP